MAGQPNHYAVLGISPSASAEDIEAAYHRLIAEGTADAETRAAVEEAYAVLSDPFKRRRYDRGRTTTRRPRSSALWVTPAPENPESADQPAGHSSEQPHDPSLGELLSRPQGPPPGQPLPVQSEGPPKEKRSRSEELDFSDITFEQIAGFRNPGNRPEHRIYNEPAPMPRPRPPRPWYLRRATALVIVVLIGVWAALNITNRTGRVSATLDAQRQQATARAQTARLEATQNQPTLTAQATIFAVGTAHALLRMTPSPTTNPRGVQGDTILSDALGPTVDALVELGSQLVDADAYPEAIDFFTSALEMQPDDARLYLVRAFAYSLLGEQKGRAGTEYYEAAEDDLNTAIAMEEDLTFAWFLRGLLYFSRWQTDFQEHWRTSALDDFNHYLELVGEDDEFDAAGYIARLERAAP